MTSMTDLDLGGFLGALTARACGARRKSWIHALPHRVEVVVRYHMHRLPKFSRSRYTKNGRLREYVHRDTCNNCVTSMYARITSGKKTRCGIGRGAI